MQDIPKSDTLWLALWMTAKEILNEKEFDEWLFVVGLRGENLQRLSTGIFTLIKMLPNIAPANIVQQLYRQKIKIQKEMESLDYDAGNDK